MQKGRISLIISLLPYFKLFTAPPKSIANYLMKNESLLRLSFLPRIKTSFYEL